MYALHCVLCASIKPCLNHATTLGNWLTLCIAVSMRDQAVGQAGHERRLRDLILLIHGPMGAAMGRAWA